MPTGRALQRFYGWLYGVLAVGAAMLPVFVASDEAGPWFALLFFVVLALRSAWHFREARKLPPDEPAFPDTSQLPLDERAAILKRAGLIGSAGIAALSAWAAWDLAQLERGATQYVRLWAPIVMLYEMGGYWVAVLGMPTLWIAFLAYCYLKLRRDAASAGA